ncbi:MAG TPA: hypothetical protein V6C65_33275, partial [Allocoleopsis sp.]
CLKSTDRGAGMRGYFLIFLDSLRLTNCGLLNQKPLYYKFRFSFPYASFELVPGVFFTSGDPYMTYPNSPGTPTGRKLVERFEREAVKILLIGNSTAVQQCVLELERRGFVDSYAWSQELPIPESNAAIRSHQGEVMRVYKRWYPPTTSQIPI